MSEKVEKCKQNVQTKHIPKDAQVIMSILRDIEITEYEPRVINQLLEFTYRYVACILEDGKTYANHAKKKSVDIDDVKLALKIQLEHSFTASPPRDLFTEVARSRNSMQLPLIKSHCGIRLPQDRHCLSFNTVPNAILLFPCSQSSKKGVKLGGSYSSNMAERNLKLSSKVNIGMVKRTLPIMSRTQTVTMSKPPTKFTNVPPKTVAKPKITITQNNSASGTGTSSSASSTTNTNTATILATEDENTSTSNQQLKRKRETLDYNVHL